jgi:tRNA-Thr(GGU) m(6)t(6)A37 methyltransferase TsaA
MREIKYKPIGIVHSPHREPKGTPIQPSAATGVKATVEIFPEFAEGLTDLDGFSHIFIIYHCHLVGKSSLKVQPYMDNDTHGVFSTRAPSRPNPIGLSVVRLVSAEGNLLHIQDVDILDGTPVLDIKPLVPEFDMREVKRIGWLKKNVNKLPKSKDDGRFQA